MNMLLVVDRVSQVVVQRNQIEIRSTMFRVTFF